MKTFSRLALCVAVGMLALACSAVAPKKEPPVQVIYRFDDHRFLELTGFYCQGGLTYVDTQRNIRHQIYDISDGYRVFTKIFIHPSTRYIVVPEFNNASSFFISKDYGQTWVGARMIPGGGAQRYGDHYPEYESVASLTVVNDQGFIQTQSGDLYMSSKPFDDPRLQPGAEGIPYIYKDVRNNPKNARLMPGRSGLDWGREYISWNAVNDKNPWTIFAWKPNWQNIPNKVPIVKNYTGWDRMQCNPDLGLKE